MDAQDLARAFNDREEIDPLTRLLNDAVNWFNEHRPQTGPGTLPTWVTDARRALGRKW